MKDYWDRRTALIHLINSYTESIEEQKITISWVEDMEDAGESKDQVIRQLVGWLHDGTYAGNWPWVLLRQITK